MHSPHEAAVPLQLGLQAFSAIPDKLKKSITVDNGKDFAAHQELAEATGMKVFFL